MAAAAPAPAPAVPEVFVSQVTIQLRQQPRIYEWRTQVIGQAQEAPMERVSSGKTAAAASTAAATLGAAAAATPIYRPPRIQGNEAQRKQLRQTLSNFFEAERYDSALNRLTK